MLFISVSQFKAKLNISAIEVVINPKTQKQFASTSAGNFKVEHNLDASAPIRFMYEDEATFSEGCLVNITPQAAPLFTL